MVSLLLAILCKAWRMQSMLRITSPQSKYVDYIGGSNSFLTRHEVEWSAEEKKIRKPLVLHLA